MAITAWLRSNKIAICCSMALFILFGIVMWISFLADPLADLKKKVQVNLSPEAENTAKEVLECIARNDMKGLFQLMVNRDGDFFQGAYVEGLFAEKNFCPAYIVNEPPQRIAKSSVDHVILKLYSESRKKYYSMGLQRVRGKYRVSVILQVPE